MDTLEMFCRLENANLVALEQDTPSCFTAFARHRHFQTFWGDYLQFTLVTRRHCLEYVLRQGLEYVGRREFGNAARLLGTVNAAPTLCFLQKHIPGVRIFCDA